MNSESSNLPVGASLQGGKYRIIRVLGQGGFGITYLAEQTGLGMKVAIKEFFLRGSCQRDGATSEVSVPVTDNAELVAKCLKKFKSEARKIASLNHDHIVNIIDIFDENGTSYYVMKHLSGGSLADRIKNKSMREEDALKVIKEISDALQSIHSHGLLHLDIKPANILFDERGRSVLIDFGVSKYVDSEKDTTTTSSLVGFSRGFAPLEQMNATVSTLTPATDLYALGATLYNLVVGVAPPDASLVMDNGLPEMPAGISDEVKEAITRCMQPRRKDRPQDVESFLELLPVEVIPQPQVSEPEEEVTVVVQKEEPRQPVKQSFISKYSLIISAAMLVSAVLISGAAFLKNRKVETPAPVETQVTAQSPEVTNQINALTQSNNDLKKQLNDLKSKENSLTQTNSSLRKQVDDLKNQVSTQTSKINTLEKDNTNLRLQVNSYKPDAERWRRQMEVNN
jgi:serine/threonine-protein kinase